MDTQPVQMASMGPSAHTDDELPSSFIEDETTPSTALGPDDRPTPLPKMQMTILLLLLLCEPVSGFVIYPFVAQVR